MSPATTGDTGVWITIRSPDPDEHKIFSMFVDKDSEHTVEDGWLAGHTIQVEQIRHLFRLPA